MAEKARVLEMVARRLEQMLFRGSGFWEEEQEDRSHFIEEEEGAAAVVRETGAGANRRRGVRDGARWEVMR